jgi:hypothetical protein
MVAKLRELDRFKEKVEFIELPKDRTKRLRMLEQIEGRAAFIWGDGTNHQESYFFTQRQTGISLKANIDAHQDHNKIEADWMIDHDMELNCGIHMTRTENDGIEIILRPIATYEGFLTEIEKRVGSYRKGSISITVDCDVFPLFPACHSWVSDSGIETELIVDLIRKISPHIARFDIGGIVEGIAKFTLVAKHEIGTPTLEEVKLVSRYQFSSENQDWRFVAKETFDRVCSRAFWIYADVLGAFFGLND